MPEQNRNNIRVLKPQEQPPRDRWSIALRNADSLLHQLIELNPERAKEIIAKIAESNRAKAA